MLWQAIQDFLTGNANLIGAIAGLVVIAGAVLARGLWMYRCASRRDKPAVPAAVTVTKEARQDETRKRRRPTRSA